MKIYLNGDFVEKAEAKISVFDHGFLYGDGAFEGIRAYNRIIFKLEEHVDRLLETMHTLMIELSLSKAQLIEAIVDTLKINNLDDAYIRLIVTRGEGDLGLDPRKCVGKASVIIIVDTITLYSQELYEKGMDIITVPTMRNCPEALNPQLKSLNYLNNILAKIEANNSGFSEAIMLDHLGYVAECTGDNIFLVKNDMLVTPSQGFLKGITRQTVLDLARKNQINVREGLITRHEVYTADECFLTGTAAEIIPVVKVDGRVIGHGVPGLVTTEMMKMFKNFVQEEGVNY